VSFALGLAAYAPGYAQTVNYDCLLSDRARECWAYQGPIPNFRDGRFLRDRGAAHREHAELSLGL